MTAARGAGTTTGVTGADPAALRGGELATTAVSGRAGILPKMLLIHPPQPLGRAGACATKLAGAFAPEPAASGAAGDAARTTVIGA